MIAVAFDGSAEAQLVSTTQAHALITFSSFRGSPRTAVYVPSPLVMRGTSSCTPPVAVLSFWANRAVRVVDMRVRPEALAGAEHGVEVECRGASVGRQQRVLWHTQLRGLIERDVVIGELPDERRTGRHRRVVRVGRLRNLAVTTDQGPCQCSSPTPRAPMRVAFCRQAMERSSDRNLRAAAPTDIGTTHRISSSRYPSLRGAHRAMQEGRSAHRRRLARPRYSSAREIARESWQCHGGIATRLSRRRRRTGTARATR
jgi:hypothetical protein